MVALDDIFNLSPDPAEAFVQFEALCRARMEEAIARLDPNDSWEDPRMEYMSRVQAASEAYEVDPTQMLASDDRLIFGDFQWFNHAALRLVTRLQIRAAREVSKELIELEPADKAQIRAEVERLRNRIEASALLDAEWKTTVKRKLDDLLSEIDKPRVKVGAVAAILIALAPFVGQVEDDAIKLPQAIVGIMDTLSIATARGEERRALLERYRKPMAIENHSKAELEQDDRAASLDDEIPF